MDVYVLPVGNAGRSPYLAASMLTGQETVLKVDDASAYSGQKIEIEKPKCFSYLHIVDPISYGYFIEAVKLSQGTEFI